ncbi:hypothetical protein MMC11_000101 [Xylographa trunciseda]|nr:hypothetical protein [Xylographa trunciseda]
MEQNEVAKTPNRTQDVDIDANGDVILHLSSETKLRVSSKVLSLASPVFKAMFRSGFAEGSALIQNGSCYVHLSDDNPEAVTRLCRVLHHRSRIPKVWVGNKLMEDMAVLSDKYDCVQSMAYWSTLCLGVGIRAGHEGTTLDGLLFPVFTFDQPEYFQLVTKRMVYTMMCAGMDTYYNMPQSTISMLPKDLVCMLMQFLMVYICSLVKAKLIGKTLQIKKEMLERIENTVKRLLEKPWPTTPGLNKMNNVLAKADVFELPHHDRTFFSQCDSNHVSAFMKEMYKQGLWKIGDDIPGLSLVELLAKLKNCSFPQIPHVKNGSTTCETCSLNLDVRLAHINTWGRTAFDGLCLDCVKYGDTVRQGGCRIGHPGGPGARGLK